mmetsp:Transcript_7663/g.27270  ORF Transcript_7663/g.27270 Transcript_7663/m.27270 type:complete len:200 (-) Transcript_7663:134-733(-)
MRISAVSWWMMEWMYGMSSGHLPSSRVIMPISAVVCTVLLRMLGSFSSSRCLSSSACSCLCMASLMRPHRDALASPSVSTRRISTAAIDRITGSSAVRSTDTRPFMHSSGAPSRSSAKRASAALRAALSARTNAPSSAANSAIAAVWRATRGFTRSQTLGGARHSGHGRRAARRRAKRPPESWPCPRREATTDDRRRRV